jgi:hypothetical protein
MTWPSQPSAVRLLGFLHLLHQALGQEGLPEAPRVLGIRDLQSLESLAGDLWILT